VATRRFGVAGSRPRRRYNLRVAVVGLGYWGPNLLRVLYELDGVEVRYVCDLDEERLKRATTRYPSVEGTTSFERLLDDPELDAIVLATPVHTHFELAQQCLEAGKHTFVEKPLASSRAEAEELIQLAEDADLSLMCGHTFLYSPAVRAVKTMIERGELGQIYFISSSRVNLGLHQRDASVIWDLGPHDFSILLYWLEESPKRVSAVGRASVVPNVTDVAFIDLLFPSGPLAHVELSWLAPSKLRRTVVVGSERMVVYDDTSVEPVRVFDSGVTYREPETFGEFHLAYRTGDIVSPHLDTVEPLSLELGDFLHGIRGGRRPLWNTALALNVVALIECAESSLMDRGAPAYPETDPLLTMQ
jgi:predicted dehydrogenase